jgi:hypothetical protein
MCYGARHHSKGESSGCFIFCGVGRILLDFIFEPMERLRLETSQSDKLSIMTFSTCRICVSDFPQQQRHFAEGKMECSERY